MSLSAVNQVSTILWNSGYCCELMRYNLLKVVAIVVCRGIRNGTERSLVYRAAAIRPKVVRPRPAAIYGCGGMG